ncbi:MAG: FtsX-like permease family protein [Dehalococcoidia bacterium]|nr:FtsX-like permease family protein [Dehalococcoidia bacterium]
MIKSLKVAAFLALKSIVRGNIGVIVLTVFMLILVTMNLLFVPALISGATQSMNTILIRTYSGDIIIEPAGDDKVINHVDNLLDGIESIDGVVAASARNDINAYFTFEDRRVSRVVTGIDPVRDEEVFDIASSLIEGSYLDPRDRGEILLGIQLAGADQEDIELYSSSLRHVHAGDKVKVTYSSGIEKQYTVKGIFDTGFIQADSQAFVTQLEFNSVMPNMNDKAASIRVKLEDGADPSMIIERIAGLRNDLDFQTWQQTAGLVQSMTESFTLINQILNVVNYLVAGITVFIVTYVDVINRRRQIGIQRAIGIKSQSITISYLIRALFYAIVGLIIGILVFKYVVIPVEARHPFQFPFGPAYLLTRPSYTARMAFILLVVSLAAAFIPVWRVMRIKILDAIWG